MNILCLHVLCIIVNYLVLFVIIYIYVFGHSVLDVSLKGLNHVSVISCWRYLICCFPNLFIFCSQSWTMPNKVIVELMGSS